MDQEAAPSNVDVACLGILGSPYQFYRWNGISYSAPLRIGIRSLRAYPPGGGFSETGASKKGGGRSKSSQASIQGAEKRVGVDLEAFIQDRI